MEEEEGREGENVLLLHLDKIYLGWESVLLSFLKTGKEARKERRKVEVSGLESSSLGNFF